VLRIRLLNEERQKGKKGKKGKTAKVECDYEKHQFLQYGEV
jgi:hypothetical protein